MTFVTGAGRGEVASWKSGALEERSHMTQIRTRRAGPASEKTPREPSRQIWLTVGLFILGAGAALVALLGPLAGGIIRYHTSEGAINQIIGGDVAGLLLVAPVSVFAGVLVWRGKGAGPVLALGPSVYALYMYSQLALGGDFVRYPGNSERYFLLYLGLFVVAGAIAVRAWAMIDSDRLPVTKRWVDRTLGVFFLVVAAFLAVGLHLPGLIDAWADQPTSAEYLADPAVFWLVKFMDLGIVVPGIVMAGIGMLSARPWVVKLEYAAVGWAALLGSSVAGMAIVMQITGDPAASVANTVAFGSFAAIALAMAAVVYTPLLRKDLR